MEINLGGSSTDLSMLIPLIQANPDLVAQLGASGGAGSIFASFLSGDADPSALAGLLGGGSVPPDALPPGLEVGAFGIETASDETFDVQGFDSFDDDYYDDYYDDDDEEEEEEDDDDLPDEYQDFMGDNLVVFDDPQDREPKETDLSETSSQRSPRSNGNLFFNGNNDYLGHDWDYTVIWDLKEDHDQIYGAKA